MKSSARFHTSRRNEKIKFAKTGPHMFTVIPFLFEIKVNTVICAFHRNDEKCTQEQRSHKVRLCCLDVQIRAVTKV